MPVSTVERAMGSVWRTPAPHKGDVIDILAKTDGVTVRIERKGLIGRIDFNSRFMHTIASIPMGTSLADLRGTVPEMEMSEDSTASGVHVSARNS
ncbi:hypothetical protein RHEC894_PE00240 (plasmid) [Rhizobium sp. CIAT894]|nr:hypothetical protein RHEC894_PE00240 [Rhizobium sp. CIAT894]